MLLQATKPSFAPRRRGLRRDEYDVMVSHGLFEGQRVELLDGDLIEMAPQNAAHAYAIQVLTRLLVRGVGDRADTRVQLPLAISDNTEPEPDLALVAATPPSDAHPRTAWLVIEVAESSLYYDRGQKLRSYARAGIPEYWVVSTERRCVYRYRRPVGEEYVDESIIPEDGSISPDAFPDVTVQISALLAR